MEKQAVSQKHFSRMLLALVAFIFILHSVAQAQFLYWRYWYFDMPMHFLGGVFLGFLVVYCILFFYKQTDFSKKYYWVLIILFWVFVLSIGWEFYEFFIDHSFSTRVPNYLDTFSDFGFDLAGGCVSILFLIKRKIL